MYKITCCHKCEKRHILCHSTCEEYLAERKALDEYNKEKRKENELKQTYQAIKGEAIRRTQKRYKR